jgi:hypothetical protein
LKNQECEYGNFKGHPDFHDPSSMFWGEFRNFILRYPSAFSAEKRALGLVSFCLTPLLVCAHGSIIKTYTFSSFHCIRDSKHAQKYVAQSRRYNCGQEPEFQPFPNGK